MARSLEELESENLRLKAQLQADGARHEEDIKYLSSLRFDAIGRVAALEISADQERLAKTTANEALTAAREQLAQAETAHSGAISALRAKLTLVKKELAQAQSVQAEELAAVREELATADRKLVLAQNAHGRELGTAKDKLDAAAARLTAVQDQHAKASSDLNQRKLRDSQQERTDLQRKLSDTNVKLLDSQQSGAELKGKLAESNDNLAASEIHLVSLQANMDAVKKKAEFWIAKFQDFEKEAREAEGRAASRITELEKALAITQEDLQQARAQHAVHAEDRDSLRTEISTAHTVSASLRRGLEGLQKTSNDSIRRLCYCITQISLPSEAYTVFLDTLRTSVPMGALTSQPYTGVRWKVQVPWFASDGDEGSCDEGDLVAFRRPLPLLLSLFAAAKAGKTATPLGVHFLGLLASHLRVAVKVQAELVLYVLGALVDDLVDKDAGCVLTWSVLLAIWQVANILDAQWPGTDVVRVRQAVQGQPRELALAIDAGSVVEFIKEKGVISGDLGMLACPGGAPLIVDNMKETIRGATTWRTGSNPTRVEVSPPDGSATLTMPIDFRQKPQIRWWVRLNQKMFGPW
ncbi:hypothetical protein C8A01DRAFT_42024 [Parachaetomium inaequale]|uniref:Uncharacterized protein n=1 Tax=Parachaetomium inaequale TaxID=2588326 RepID=A0AAN6P4I2_9PEZI|nr:hypothetical protein C8A01DRAFT_42024 [Parachaetomium inaequale]